MSPRPRGWAARTCAVLAGLLLLTACGEPPIDVQIPARDGQVADLAGVLEAPERLAEQLAGYAAEGVDIVVLTYTTEAASCGEAFRAGREFVAAWEADVAMVAVAAPGGFADAEGRRCVGLQPLDDFAVGRGTREEVTESLWPPLLADNDWDEVFAVGATALRDALAETEPDGQGAEGDGQGAGGDGRGAEGDGQGAEGDGQGAGGDGEGA